MKKLLFLILATAATMGVRAQNEVDALRYSYLDFGGTARFMATGGAFGALGADISCLHTNPAGIGLYKTSEITFSPTLFYGRTESTYNGYTLDDYKANFNIGNFGIVGVAPGKKTDGPGWRSFQFGFDLVRNNNFNNQISTYGKNTQSSLLDAWNLDANGVNPNNLSNYSTRLAFDTWLLDTVPGTTNQYWNAAPSGGVTQSQIIYSEGYMNEWALSFGGNYSDKFYFGATFGFPYLHYNETKSYTETAMSDTLGFSEFKSMNVYDYLDTRGHGFNFKFGFIYKPVDFMRIGLAMHTPTNYYHMTDNYRTTVSSTFSNGDHYESQSPNGFFDYEVNTPFRYIGSVAFIIGQHGFISGEYEFVDYSQAKLKSQYPEDFVNANNTIHQIYRSTGNLHVGGEYRMDNVSFRGGYAYYGSPFESDINDGARTSYTFGLGYREGGFFADFATVLTYANEDYYLYQKSPGVPLNPVDNRTHDQTFILTLGAKF